MMEITRFTPQICCASKLLSETVRKKFTKADVIKRIMKEHKACFGALLETKRDKARRLKLEKKGVIAQTNVEISGDSELAWMLRVSDSRLRLIKLDANVQIPVAAKVPNKTASQCAKEDDELTRVQTRIIRKTSVSKAMKSKTTQKPLESMVIVDKNCPVKSSLVRKIEEPKTLKSKTLNPPESLLVVEKKLKETEIQSQVEESNSVQSQLVRKIEEPKTLKSKIVNPLEPLLVVEKKSKETEIQSQGEETNSVQSQLVRKIKEPKSLKSETENPAKPLLVIEKKSKETEIESLDFLLEETNSVQSQLVKKIKEPKTLKSETVNPPESLVVVEKKSKEMEIQSQGEETNSVILLPREDIIENIKVAVLCQEEDEKYAAVESSEILSISPMENEEYFKFPSVTRILNATMSENAKKMLELWMARMIKQLGQEGFDEYKKGLLQNGKLLHSVIDSALRKSPVEVPDNLKSCFNSVKIVLDEVENVRVIESQVVHHHLGYRGVVDCVASYRGNLCLIDWKKSDKTKHLLSSTYDAPLQIASYIGALNADKNYPFQIKSGLLVIAYTIGDPPTVFTLDQRKLQYYWKQWLGRLKKYYTMQNT